MTFKKLRIMYKVQLTYKQSLRGVGIFSKGQKKYLGVLTVVGAVKLVRLRKGSGCVPEGVQFCEATEWVSMVSKRPEIINKVYTVLK